jgi:hypothetical protein
MNNSLIKTIASLAVALAVSNLASADPITGSVSINGIPTFLNGVVNENATPGAATVVSFSDTGPASGVSTAYGTFAPLLGATPAPTFGTISDAGAFANLPTGALTVNGPLWTDTLGSTTYSFNVTSIFGTSPGASTWDFSGSGYFAVTGDTDATGTFIITFSEGGESLSFESTSSVPDNGTTALLVGLGLVAMGVYAATRRSALPKA